MNYNEALKRIDSLLVFGSKPGLDRIRILLGMMGDPQDKLGYVHVAGTNGKGSVCNMLASVLTEAGLKTGLFTSPHITGFGERMRIDGQEIPQDELIDEVERLFPLVDELREKDIIITEFEFVTAMAFDWFSRRGCDIVVLETGMGGRFDATNVIEKPLCSIITSISLDHTAILGDTLSKIAFEKCGIIKQGGRTVFALQEQEVNERVFEAVKERENVLHIAQKLECVSTSLDGTIVEFEGEALSLHLLGMHQLLNLSLVFSAVEALRLEGVQISARQVCDGVTAVRVPARFEVMNGDPLVIVDGAHNPDGMKALSKAIEEYLGGRSIVCVLGMLRDKDCVEAVSHLKGLLKKVVTTTIPDNPRRRTALGLMKKIEPLGFDAVACEEPEKAFDKALELAGEYPDAVVLVCGSLYLVSDIRACAKRGRRGSDR